ncbi:hypothetical protein [Sulfitobacter pacificus]|uniref:hypothetical protein n=1 Tax=Sulfitobacter pacificus TaxID=1499314 RepID=UPI00333FDA70
MRDKIALIIADVVIDSGEGVYGEFDAADAIIAALPDMVVPLVWSDWSDEYCIQTWNRLAVLAKAKTEIGEYRIGRKHDYIKSTNPQKRAFDSVYSSEWYVDAPFSGFLLGPFKGDVEAKKVAQAHHAAQALSAFGITPPSTREDT